MLEYRGAGAMRFHAGERLGQLVAEISIESGARVVAVGYTRKAWRGLLETHERGGAHDGCTHRSHRPRWCRWWRGGIDVEDLELAAFTRAARRRGFDVDVGDRRGPWRHVQLRRRAK